MPRKLAFPAIAILAASSPIMPAADRGAAADRRFLHDDEAGALQMLHKALGDDRRHHLAGVPSACARCSAARRRAHRRGLRSWRE